MSDPKNTHGTPGPDEEADTASGGAPEEPSDENDSNPERIGSKSTERLLEEETTDENGMPLENPSGG